MRVHRLREMGDKWDLKDSCALVGGCYVLWIIRESRLAWMLVTSPWDEWGKPGPICCGGRNLTKYSIHLQQKRENTNRQVALSTLCCVWLWTGSQAKRLAAWEMRGEGLRCGITQQLNAGRINIFRNIQTSGMSGEHDIGTKSWSACVACLCNAIKFASDSGDHPRHYPQLRSLWRCEDE